MKQITILFLLLLIASCRIESDKNNNSTLITLEQHMQQANQIEFYRGASYFFEMSYLLIEKTSNERDTQISIFVDQMKRIVKESNIIMDEIDQLKLELLKSAKEDVVSSHKDENQNIIVRINGDKHFTDEIMHFNLSAIKDKMNINAVETVLFDYSRYKKFWNINKSFKVQLLEAIATYKTKSQNYSFTPKLSYKGETAKEQLKNFESDLKRSKANLNDDEVVLKQLFVDLFKPETLTGEDGADHTWMESTFKNKTILEAISELTSLQNEILKARSTALFHIKTRVTFCGNYSFNKFLPVVEGKTNVKIGEEVEIKVRMAAYDTYENPMITVSNPEAVVYFKGDGAATLVFKAKKGVNNLKGEIMIKKKTGEISSRPWEWEVYGVQK